MPIAIISSSFLEEFKEQTFRAKKRKFTNSMLTMFSILFNFGMVRDLAQSNPRTVVKKIPKPKDAKAVNRRWVDDEIKVIFEQSPRHLLTPILISYYTGLRKGDVLDLKKSDYKNGVLSVDFNKTGNAVDIPCTKNLQAVMDEIWHEESIYICTNSYGQKWTSDGFNSSFQKFRNKLLRNNLIRKGITFHGLRYTFATIAEEQGVDVEDVRALYGHSDSKMTRHYSKGANNTKRIAVAMSIHDK